MRRWPLVVMQGWDQVFLLFGGIYVACVVVLLMLRAHPILALIGGIFLVLPAFGILGVVLQFLFNRH